jgi:hypothetical protein
MRLARGCRSQRGSGWGSGAAAVRAGRLWPPTAFEGSGSGGVEGPMLCAAAKTLKHILENAHLSPDCHYRFLVLHSLWPLRTTNRLGSPPQRLGPR